MREKFFFEHAGHCPICKKDTIFSSENSWLRDHFLCSNCKSIPRERALMMVIKKFFPNWRSLIIHEFAPVERGVTTKLRKECSGYFSSQYFPEAPCGATVNKVRNEDIENMTFANDSIDLHISQDVLEHVFDPNRAFQEIKRTLKPGGAHIFTTPLVNKERPSICRASRNSDQSIAYLKEAHYHDNPVDAKGSLVTFDWGFDITKCIFEASGLFTSIIHIDDLSRGVRAEYIEVLITQKPSLEPYL